MGISKTKIKKYKEKGKVKKLIKASKNRDPNVRGMAVGALGGINDPEAVETIIRALKDEDRGVKERAVGILEYEADRRAVESLIEALKDETLYPKSYEKIIRALGNTKDKRAVEPLVHAALYGWEGAKNAAIVGLGKIGDKRAIEPLIAALKDDNKYTRQCAGRALKNIGVGDERVIESLILILETEYYQEARKEAVEALGKIGGKKAAERLIQILDKQINGSLHYDVEADMWKALTLIGKPAVKSLIKVLNRGDCIERAAEILGDIGDESSVEFLVPAMMRVGKKAAIALEKLGWTPEDDVAKVHYLLAKEALDELASLGEPAVDSLIQILNDKKIRGGKSFSIRGMAAKALGKTANAKALKPLLLALKDEDMLVRENAASALGALGDRRAVEPLIEAWHDETEAVRIAAVEALVMLGGPKVREALVQAMENKESPLPIRYKFAKALGKLGDKKAAAAVIEFVFTDYAHTYLSESSSFENLFGDYTSMINWARTYDTSEENVGISSPVTCYYYKLDIHWVEDLCKIDSAISSNILHMLAKITDVRDLISREEVDYMTSITGLSFEPVRKMARDELEKRGNPPYDPSAYLDEDGWKI